MPICFRHITAFVLVLVCLLGVPTIVSAANHCELQSTRPVSDGWPHYGVLVYSGYYPFGASGLANLNGMSFAGATRSDDGDWLPPDFVPYVSYVDAEGTLQQPLFDTFLFLGAQSNRGRHYGGEYDQQQASLWHDWEWYIDRIFAPGKQLAALEQAVADAADQLGLPDHRVNVYIMIPYPSYKVTDFGHPGLDDGSLMPVSNRISVIESYVDEVMERWDKLQPSHLRLAGFYWMQEHFNPDVPGERLMVDATVDYVHAKGLKLGWIPWSGAFLATNWRTYGFDWAVTQPNLMFSDAPGLMQAAVNRARATCMGFLFELDDRVLQPTWAGHLDAYFAAAIDNQLADHGPIFFYQDVASLAKFARMGGTGRTIYDKVHHYINGDSHGVD